LADDGNIEGGGDYVANDQTAVRYNFPVWLLSISLVLPILAVIYGMLPWIFVFKYRNKPIVAMGQPEFLYNICAGAILIASCMLFNMPAIVYNHDDGGVITSIGWDVCCNFLVWMGYLGYYFMYTYTALVCKMYRIILITEEPLRRGLMILPKHVMGPYIAVMMLVIGPFDYMDCNRSESIRDGRQYSRIHRHL
jgi:hypothetical protein